MRIASGIVLAFFVQPLVASASETYTPGVDYPMRGKAIASDFLYIRTEKCRDEFGPLLCSPDESWVFVEEIAGSKLRGWARGTLIRSVTCPLPDE